MKKTDRILEAVNREKQGYTGQLGFAFFDLKTGEECYLCGDEAIPVASVFKIYLLTELFRQVEAGLVSLDDRIEVTPETISPGSGVLSRFHHSVSLSVYDHAALMMALSDNTSTDKLFALVGRDNMLLPALFIIVGVLLLLRGKLDEEQKTGEKEEKPC